MPIKVYPDAKFQQGIPESLQFPDRYTTHEEYRYESSHFALIVQAFGNLDQYFLGLLPGKRLVFKQVL
jgi:hypothetical protein